MELSSKQKKAIPVTKEQVYLLIASQPVVAGSAIFHADEFPLPDFLNKDLVQAALGSYTLKTRYFDATWNEVQRPTAPGRYGALVEIHFPSGASDIRRMTLFKTAAPYHPVADPYEFTLQFPVAFGLSKEIASREGWNANQIINRMLDNEARQSDLCAVLVATLHDFAKDPARWHGFNYWHVQESWWAVLDQKLGLAQDYQHVVTLPENYDHDPSTRWPLLLFLHGTLECGNDLSKLQDQGPLGQINRGHSLPFIVVTPQCPAGNSWNPEKLLMLVERMKTSHHVDSNRIYVTGLSMGGFSTFDMAACYPDKIAAAAPLSAGENPDIVDRLKSVPLWIFHGAEDQIVSPQSSREIAERLKAMGSEVRLSVYPGVGHEGWDKIYADPALYDWFLSHRLTPKDE
jgi:hypothetical protein